MRFPLSRASVTSRWVALNAVAFVSWLGLMGLSLIMRPPPLALQLVIDIVFAIAAASGVFAALAASLRFAGSRSRVLDGLSKDALGYYVVHYPFSVWLQFALLGTALFAVAKAMIVLALSLFLSMALMTLLRLVPFGSLLVGETPRPLRIAFPAIFRGRTAKPATPVPLAPNLP